AGPGASLPPLGPAGLPVERGQAARDRRARRGRQEPGDPVARVDLLPDHRPFAGRPLFRGDLYLRPGLPPGGRPQDPPDGRGAAARPAGPAAGDPRALGALRQPLAGLGALRARPEVSSTTRRGGMAVCPECEADIELDEYDVDKGEII